jgi:uncharacterized RDD family membrane protein YckC
VSTVWTQGNGGADLRPATFQHRLGALALDAALLISTCYIGWIIWSLVVWGEGQTPGKKILKIRVYGSETRTPVTWGHMAIRSFLLYFAVGLSAGLLNLITLGVIGTLLVIAWYTLEIVFYFKNENRTVSDIMVKTLVVNEA